MRLSPVFAAFAACCTAAAFAANPEITAVTATPNAATNAIAVSYTIANTPAMVTVDVRTNGVSIGGQHVWTLAPADAINCRIDADGTYSFTWDCGADWDDPAVGTVAFDVVVTAWATNAPPPVMVLGLVAGDPEPLKYYESEAFLPGGLLANAAYRTTKLVMKRCMVKGNTYTLGSPSTVQGYSSRNKERQVSFTHDFYLGVFEFTQGQWEAVAGAKPPAGKFDAQDWQLRPCTHCSMVRTRESSVSAKYDSANLDTAYRYPLPPHDDSLFGRIKARTGVAVDLPSENRWEVAARPGTAAYGWNGVAPQIDSNGMDPNFPDRYKFNGGNIYAGGAYSEPSNACDADVNGTAKAGSYAPNDWGFYDMCGNVAEFMADNYAWALSTTEDAKMIADSTQTLTKGTSWNGSANGGFAAHGIQGYHTNNKHVGFRIYSDWGMK